MRTGTRVSPSWPGLGPEAGYVEADRSRRTRRNHLQRGVRVMARPCGELAVAHGAQRPAERLLGDHDADLLEDPLCQIDQPPTHHAVDCRNRATLNHAGDGLALDVVELGRLPRRLSV